MGVFHIDIEQENINKVEEFLLHGTWPRHFALQGDMLVVADQKEAFLEVLDIDEDTGKLTSSEIFEDLPENPTFVGFYSEATEESSSARCLVPQNIWIVIWVLFV